MFFTCIMTVTHFADFNPHFHSFQFLNLCCKCFAKLAIDNELKSVMLEKACDQNNSIMVECLLLLGADANRAKEATSLICQVNIQRFTFVFFCMPLLLYSSHLYRMILHYRIYQFMAQLLVICSRVQIQRVLEIGYFCRYYLLIIPFTCLPTLLR